MPTQLPPDVATGACTRAAALTYRRLDGELPPAAAGELLDHLAACAPCARAAAEEPRFHAWLARRLPRLVEPAPPTLRARVAALLDERA